MTSPSLVSPLFAQRGSQVLFEEDFDLPATEAPPAVEPPPEPEVIEPVFTAAELKAAREEAWREADELARAELNGARERAAQAALSTIAEQLRNAREQARKIAESSAEAIAQLLLASFAAAFPAMCRQHGEAEIRAVLQQILPALESEPKLTIRVAPEAASGVRRELDRLDNDLAAAIQIVPVDTMAPSDVRIQWRAGQASRDAAQIWDDIKAALAPAGLLPPSLDAAKAKLKETADVE
jgi:flagellar assembly protein FliH